MSGAAEVNERWDCYRQALGLHEANPTPSTRDLVEHAAHRWQRAYVLEMSGVELDDGDQSSVPVLTVIAGGKR